MARKKVPRSKIETRTSFTYPDLHHEVVKAISKKVGAIWFQEDIDDEDFDNEYPTHVMGRFKCTNRACPTNGWGSKKIAIYIKGYAGNGYNAEVFNQSCRQCSRLGTLILDEKSYVDRVAYRIQKWAGIRMGEQVYSKKKGPPHERRFCEGCKRGVCEEGSGYGYD